MDSILVLSPCQVRTPDPAFDLTLGAALDSTLDCCQSYSEQVRQYEITATRLEAEARRLRRLAAHCRVEAGQHERARLVLSRLIPAGAGGAS